MKQENLEKILLADNQLSLIGIKNYYVDAKNKEEKLDILTSFLMNINLQLCMIFCNNAETVQDICEHLGKREFPVD